MTFKVWAPDAAYDDEPVILYEAADGELPKTFADGEIDVVVDELSIFIEHREALNAVFIQNANTGMLLAISPFKWDP